MPNPAQAGAALPDKAAVGAANSAAFEVEPPSAELRYAKDLRQDRLQQYADLEAQAQEERRGQWADTEPMPPRD